MAEEARLNVRFKDSKVLEKLSELAQKKDCSLNQLACEVLEKYVKCADDYVLDAIPMVIKSIVREEIKSINSTSDEVLKDIYTTIIKLRKVTETLVTFLMPEFNEAEYDNLKAEQLEKLLTAIESEKRNGR